MLGTAPAFAHAVLLGSNPADRESVAVSPDEVLLRFNAAVELVFVRVFDSTGRIVAVAVPRAADALIRLPLPGTLPPGQYLVTYRVTSADAHPVAGTLLFAVVAGPDAWTPPEVSAEGAAALQLAAAVNRALHFLSLSVAAGATLFLLLSGTLRNALRPTASATIAVGVTTAVLAIPLQGGLVLDVQFAALLSGDVWRAGMSTTQGRASLIAALLLIALWNIGWRPEASATRVPALVAMALLTTLALTGHVVTAANPWISVPVLLAHSVPAMVWVGSFVPLIVALDDRSVTERTLARFARIAPWGLAILVPAGAGVAWLQVQAWDGVIHTRYGNIVVAKTALVAILLSVAAVNRWRLAPRLRNEPKAAIESLRRSMGFELAIGGAILAITAALAQTPPPRSLFATPAANTGELHNHGEAPTDEGYAVGAVAQGKTAILSLAPARAGINTLTVALRGQGWSGPEPLEITAAISNAVAGVEPIVRTLLRRGVGLYEFIGPEFAIPGEWTVKIDVLVNDFEKVTYTAPIPVQ